jgi:hypothetical protein
MFMAYKSPFGKLQAPVFKPGSMTPSEDELNDLEYTIKRLSTLDLVLSPDASSLFCIEMRICSPMACVNLRS